MSVKTRTKPFLPMGIFLKNFQALTADAEHAVTSNLRAPEEIKRASK